VDIFQRVNQNRYLIAIFILILIFVLYWSYTNVKPEIRNLNGDTIGILGHRGMSRCYHYPGNSLPSILEALRIGAIGCELDVQLTKDGSLVAYHHKELDQYTNFKGSVRDHEAGELMDCHYKGDHPENVSLVLVDRLFEILGKDNEYIFSFDCKFNIEDEKERVAHYVEFIDAIETLVNKHDMNNRIFIEADHVDFHRLLRSRGISVRQFITGNGVKKGLIIASELGLFGIGVGSRISKKEVERAHGLGLRVMTWTPTNAFSNARAVRKNPDYIQTADVAHLVKLLERERGPE